MICVIKSRINLKGKATRPSFGRGFFTARIVLASLLLLETACQKQNIKINGTALPVLLSNDHGPLGIPIELPGALEAARNYFQTRGVVTLVINSSQISPSSSLELTNSSTGTSLIKAPAGAFGLTGAESKAQNLSWSLDDVGYDFVLNIYPLDPNFSGKFLYGNNNLVLNIDESTAPKESEQTITMQDFQYLSRVNSVFADNVQQQENFQGEMVNITGPFVSNGVAEISNTTIGMLNR